MFCRRFPTELAMHFLEFYVFFKKSKNIRNKSSTKSSKNTFFVNFNNFWILKKGTSSRHSRDRYQWQGPRKRGNVNLFG